MLMIIIMLLLGPEHPEHTVLYFKDIHGSVEISYFTFSGKS